MDAHMVHNLVQVSWESGTIGYFPVWGAKVTFLVHHDDLDYQCTVRNCNLPELSPRQCLSP